ncbi:MAG TPA: SGNH/GDSL hydrolase family protein [Candidatus Dormibacteraeota bacterium]|nr:SGNH/GDSL hydrolase family protein [Candidatus Dormibacteraeota bacterium]
MPIKTVCMGDSITVGQFIAPAVRWTTLIERSLAEEFGPDAVFVLNHGLNGETTRGGLERFPAAVQSERPDILALQYGMNDCNCWVSDAGAHRVTIRAFKANLLEMIDRARLFGIREVILSTNPSSLRSTVMANGEVYEDANARYSEAVREVALEAEVTLCDIHAAFGNLSGQRLEELLLPSPDLLHLSEAGHLRYAELIYPKVAAAVATAAVAEPS